MGKIRFSRSEPHLCLYGVHIRSDYWKSKNCNDRFCGKKFLMSFTELTLYSLNRTTAPELTLTWGISGYINLIQCILLLYSYMKWENYDRRQSWLNTHCNYNFLTIIHVKLICICIADNIVNLKCSWPSSNLSYSLIVKIWFQLLIRFDTHIIVAITLINKIK